MAESIGAGVPVVKYFTLQSTQNAGSRLPVSDQWAGGAAVVFGTAAVPAGERPAWRRVCLQAPWSASRLAWSLRGGWLGRWCALGRAFSGRLLLGGFLSRGLRGLRIRLTLFLGAEHAQQFRCGDEPDGAGGPAVVGEGVSCRFFLCTQPKTAVRMNTCHGSRRMRPPSFAQSPLMCGSFSIKRHIREAFS